MCIIIFVCAKGKVKHNTTVCFKNKCVMKDRRLADILRGSNTVYIKL